MHPVYVLRLRVRVRRPETAREGSPLALIAAIGALSLTDAGSIAAIVAGALAVLALVYGVGRWLYRRFRTWRPLRVCFLIPQSHYKRIERFPGAPELEQEETDLAVGVGTYPVLLKVRPRMDVHVHRVRVEFREGDEDAHPIDLGEATPFFVEELGEVAGKRQVRDWWGSVHTAPLGVPRDIAKGVPLVVGRRITTRRRWSGKLSVYVELRTLDGAISRMPRTDLGFHVVESEAGDRLRFMREDGDSCPSGSSGLIGDLRLGPERGPGARHAKVKALTG
jgi:hypothetical protein